MKKKWKNKIFWTLTIPIIGFTYTVFSQNKNSIVESQSRISQFAKENRNIDSTLLTNNDFFTIKDNTLTGLTEEGKQQDKLIIPQSVTSIADFAFNGCIALYFITIPSSVTSIGSGIFKGCSNLCDVTNNSTVLFDWWVQHHDYNGQTLSQMTDIDLNNFTNNDGQQFTCIGEHAFAKCDSLKHITIPSSVTSIGSSIFEGCSNLCDVTNNSTVLFDWWVENHEYILPDGSKQTLSQMSNIDLNICTNSQNIFFTSIASYAFIHAAEIVKDSLIFNPYITSICAYAFMGIYVGAKPIILPSSVTYIGDHALNWLGSPDIYVCFDNIISIGKDAFAGRGCCPDIFVRNKEIEMKIHHSVFSSAVSIHVLNSLFNITKNTLKSLTPVGQGQITINKDNLPTYIKTIDSNSFKNDTWLTQIEFPSAITEIKDYAFDGCLNLEKIIIPSSVTSIGWGAFTNCSPDAKYYVSTPTQAKSLITGSNINPASIFPVDGDENSLYYIKNNVLLGLTYKGKQQANIEIPNTITSIGYEAFSDCVQLKAVSIPNSVTSIGDFAFESCKSLKLVNLNTQEANVSNLKFGTNPFEDCPSDILYYVQTDILKQKMEKELGIDSNHILVQPFFSITNHTLTELTAKGKEQTELVIPDGITAIGPNAFKDSKATNITIPNTVTKFDTNAFTGLINPDKVIYHVFNDANKQALIQVKINPNQIILYQGNFITQSTTLIGLTELGKKQTNIEIPNEIVSINANAFKDSQATNITIPNTIKKIDVDTFKGLSDKEIYNVDDPKVKQLLLDIKIPNNQIILTSGNFITQGTVLINLTDLGKKQTNIEIPDGVTTINANVFLSNTSLEQITIPSSVTTIQPGAFNGCIKLKAITFTKDSQLKSIADNTFKGCIALVTIDIPLSVSSVAKDAFSGCTISMTFNVHSEALRTSLLDCQLNAKSNIQPNQINVTTDFLITKGTKLDSLTALGKQQKQLQIPSYVTSIADNTFKDDTVITSIVINTDISIIGTNAFQGCTSLKSIEIKGTNTAIGTNAFAGCPSDTQYTVQNEDMKHQLLNSNSGINSSQIVNLTAPTPVNNTKWIITGSVVGGLVVIFLLWWFYMRWSSAGSFKKMIAYHKADKLEKQKQREARRAEKQRKSQVDSSTDDETETEV